MQNELSVAENEAGLAIVSSVLARQKAKNIRKLKLFFFVINLLSVVRTGKTFASGSLVQQQTLAAWLHDCPVSLLRKGFWGLSTLCKMSVYGVASVQPRLGYQVRSLEEAESWAKRLEGSHL